MNARNLAIRCAHAYLVETDPTKWSYAQRMLIADAITTGLADYWALAPEYITAPENLGETSVVQGQQDITLPAGFQAVTRPLLRRTSTAEQWVRLEEAVIEPVGLTGSPRFYRVLPTIAAAPMYDEQDEGGEVPDYIVRLYPAADTAYLIDLAVQYESPVVRARHLVGGAPAIQIPVPDMDLITMVVPLCGPAFWKLSFRKQTLNLNELNLDVVNARRLVGSKPARLTRTQGRIGIPNYY